MTLLRLPLTRDRILAAALAYADREGLTALSMRKVGAELGVEAMSLYNHIANKAEIVAGITDLVAAEIALPGPDFDWKGQMRARSASAHAVLMKHPWAVSQFMEQTAPGPHMMTYLDATLGCLMAVGFTPLQADTARVTIDNHIYGFTRQRLTRPQRTREIAREAKRELKSLPAQGFSSLRRRAEALAVAKPEEINDFEFGLDLILDGLDRLTR
ncbi:TetR/AcrR family transcriptional regulator C-terminal domain-containing protein [Pseudooceanicola sp. C21-150M6]|uniref:TetR/AcrR family transcriptional regulator C-terminal domain-containing protein n=1 Tax=Pseudooceanicola sp. C21-150M6 TaxID=3434355 RepID=UPI003D7F1F3F